MVKFVIKRLLMIIPTLLVVSLAVFLLCNITPSDPGRIKLGVDAPQEAVDQINHELGYDRPLLVRYGMWVWDALHGDFGTSYYTNRNVFTELLARFLSRETGIPWEPALEKVRETAEQHTLSARERRGCRAGVCPF